MRRSRLAGPDRHTGGAGAARRRVPLRRLGGGPAPFAWGAVAVVLAVVVVGVCAGIGGGWSVGTAAALGGALALAVGVVSGTSILVSIGVVVQVLALGGTVVAARPASGVALAAGVVAWLAAEAGWTSLDLRPGARASTAVVVGRLTDLGALAGAGLVAGTLAAWLGAGPGGDPLLLRAMAVLVVLATLTALWWISRPAR